MTRPPLKQTTPPSQPPPSNKPQPVQIKFGHISDASGHRIMTYGTGGIGKTELAAKLALMLNGKHVAFVDADESLPRLRGQFIEQKVPQPLVVPVDSWSSLRSALSSPGWDDIGGIVLDSVTKIEEWAVAHTVETVKHEKGHKVSCIEDYGYGKGYGHVFDTFLPILSDLDVHCRAGRHVLLIAHECVATVPNPEGEDWIRYEPRLQDPASGKASIRRRIKEWCDHVLFLGYDVAVDKSGVGKGSGTRTLYTAELPSFMAKSRTTQTPIPVVREENIWAHIIK